MRLRCFVAVGLPDAVRAEAEAAVAGLRSSCGDVRWASAEGLHVTLKFLGSVEETRVAELEAALRRAASRRPPFRARLSGIGAFPGVRRPQVVWTGLGEGGAELVELARAVEEEFEAAGFEPEPRPFRPHVTLGRCPGGGSPQTADAVSATHFDGRETWTVGTLRLYKSRTGAGGSVYEVLREAPLAPVN